MNSRLCVIGVIKKGDKILLGRKPKGVGPYPDTWHIVGGGVNIAEESCEQAMEREIYEEAGVRVKNLKRSIWMTDIEPNKHGIETYYVYLVFECEWESGEIKPGDDMEHFEWVEISKLGDYAHNRPSKLLFKTLGLL